MVVGCGDGRGAAFLHQFFRGAVVGVDLLDDFDRSAASVVDLRVMDAMHLDFDDDTFDLVYSFHVMEHVADPGRALSEMKRVSRQGGFYCVGTPNRHRLVGYVGSATSLRNKLRWNLADYRKRLTGRFRNEYGAHAGFSSRELSGLCEEAFGNVEVISPEYYRRLYSNKLAVIKGLIVSGASRFIFPSVYMLGRC